MGRFAGICVAGATLALTFSAAGCGDDPDKSDERRTFADASDTTAPTRQPSRRHPRTRSRATSRARRTPPGSTRSPATTPLPRARSRRRSSRSTFGTKRSWSIVPSSEIRAPASRRSCGRTRRSSSEIVDVSSTQVTQEDALLDVGLAPTAR